MVRMFWIFICILFEYYYSNYAHAARPQHCQPAPAVHCWLAHEPPRDIRGLCRGRSSGALGLRARAGGPGHSQTAHGTASQQQPRPRGRHGTIVHGASSRLAPTAQLTAACAAQLRVHTAAASTARWLLRLDVGGLCHAAHRGCARGDVVRPGADAAGSVRGRRRRRHRLDVVCQPGLRVAGVQLGSARVHAAQGAAARARGARQLSAGEAFSAPAALLQLQRGGHHRGRPALQHHRVPPDGRPQGRAAAVGAQRAAPRAPLRRRRDLAGRP